MSDDVVVKKVQPYPIRSTFEFDDIKIPGQIKKLVQHGFLIELDHPGVLVNKKGRIYFETPVLRDFVNAPVKVIKTYDKHSGALGDAEATPAAAANGEGEGSAPAPSADGAPKSKKIERLVEMHFTLLTESQTEYISAFLVKIGQAR